MELRQRLYNALLKEPMSFRALSQETGVDQMVLARFLQKMKPIRFSTGLKIEAWLDKKEIDAKKEKQFNP